MVKTFVMSDESVNSYGYRVLTDGISMETFEKNPVMLYSHNSDVLPIGKWENIRKEGGKLLADAVFDEKDELAMQVKQKVEDGIIKCCSIGFRILAVSDDASLALPGQKYSTVTGAELLECSVCAIGANRNAMVLYDKDGMELKEDNFQQLGLNLIDNNMKEIEELKEQLSKKENEITSLTQRNESLKTEIEGLKASIALQTKERIESKLAEAITKGKIDASSKESWKELMLANEETATKALNALAEKTSLSSLMKQRQSKGLYEGKSWDELDKAGKLMEYKDADFEGFKNMYKNKFGVEYKE